MSERSRDEEFEHESDIAWSDSAGAFVCNETIYRTLEAIDSVAAKTSDSRALPAIFIHLPPESEVSLERQVDVVRRVVLALASKPRLEVVGALIFDAEGRILACRRPPEDVWGGWWEFPGGKREIGETPEECLKREIREELGVGATRLKKIMTVKHSYTRFRVILHVFRCCLNKGRLRPTGCKQWKWVSPSRLSAYPFPAANVKILEYLVNGARSKTIRKVNRSPNPE